MITLAEYQHTCLKREHKPHNRLFKILACQQVIQG